MFLKLCTNRKLKEWNALCNQIAKRKIALMLTQVAGIKTIGFNGDKCLSNKLLVITEGLHRSLLTGSIAIEGEDYFAAEGIGIHQQSTNNADVIITKSGSTRCNSSCNAS